MLPKKTHGIGVSVRQIRMKYVKTKSRKIKKSRKKIRTMNKKAKDIFKKRC